MKIHEYQAKQLLAGYGVPTLRSKVAHSVDEARGIAKELGDAPWVVKAQIHAGGRGKGGGVKLVRDYPELEEATKAILGMTLVTHQTGPEGQEVKKVLIEEGCDIDRELYLGMVVDRSREMPVMMASARGGMDIEKVAAEEPEAIFFEDVDPIAGLAPFRARRLATLLEIPNGSIGAFAKLATSFALAFVNEDCALGEINPLVLTGAGELVALDAKISFDENAMYRHSKNMELRDLDEENPQETRAAQFNLSYIKMDGKIGCMVNGAGLAMATMDIIKLHGSEPANFLDVGGGATKERVTEALKIILEDPGVEAILINIFGGIVRCDLIANGVVEAAKEIGIRVPVVVRLEGNMVTEGKKILADSDLDITPADDLEDAARKAVAAVEGGAR